MQKEQKSRMDFKVLGRVLKYIMKSYKLRLFFVIISLLLSTISSVGANLYLQTLIDDYIMPLVGETNPNYGLLMQAILTMASIYGVGVIAGFLSSRLMVKVSEGTLKQIRDEMFVKMEKLPLKYFDTHSHGDIMSRYTNDTDTLSQMISESIPKMFSVVTTVVVIFVSMIVTNIYLTLVVLAFLGIILIVTRFMTSRSGKYFIKQQESVGKLNGYIEEMINGQKVVKVFCYEDRAKERFDKLNEELSENVYNANKFVNCIGPVNGNLGNTLYAVIAVAGGLFAINGIGNITIGLIVAFLQLSKTFIRPINEISRQLNSLVMAVAGAKRIFEFMDEEPEADDGKVCLVNVKEEDGKLIEVPERTNKWAWKYPQPDGKIEYIKLAGRIDFIDVDFGYEEGKTVLHDISLYAKPGQKIAFVGATGAGKTTITNLINRFYDIKNGKIIYDGININEIKKDDLRLSLGMVLQDTNLFTGTIKDNIRYGKDDATDEEVIEAAKLANAHDFITRLPNGYDTEITGDGASLSQGQRQLLAIARCALCNPPVMILDEATSSIDTRTEKIVQDGMDKLMEGRTVFVIAHRLSTVRNAKAIMVLDGGRIIERGNHEDLIAEKGQYYKLYTGVFELE